MIVFHLIFQSHLLSQGIWWLRRSPITPLHCLGFLQYRTAGERMYSTGSTVVPVKACLLTLAGRTSTKPGMIQTCSSRSNHIMIHAYNNVAKNMYFFSAKFYPNLWVIIIAFLKYLKTMSFVKMINFQDFLMVLNT